MNVKADHIIFKKNSIFEVSQKNNTFKAMKHSLLVIWMISLNWCTFSQQTKDLFMPLEFQNAYKHATRDINGAPGKNYWQNESLYTIRAQVDPKEKTIKASSIATYKNNSPDTLRIMVLRLYHDLYKKGNARDRDIHPKDITDGIDLKSLKINGSKINLENNFATRRTGTNLFLRIPEKLHPGDSLLLSIEWQTKIPEKSLIRMGAINESTMFVAYWYPQISVYDDIDGWDFFDYGSRQEFYQDLAEFDVTLEVPAEYMVWATGELQNENKIYSKNVLKALEKAGQSDETVPIVESQNKILKAQKGNVEWEFKANKVPDFAFSLSNNYHWDASSVVLDSSAMNRVMVHTVYNPESKDRFKHVTEYQRQSLLYFSHDFPGVLFPFDRFTTFQGLKSGGMEFPMMANNGDYSRWNDTLDLLLTIEVTAHEIAHAYTPFYVLVNERKYTWMEEGWATLFGERATSHIQQITELNGRYSMEQMYGNRFFGTEGSQFSVPLMTPTITLKNRDTHFHISYYKAYYAYKVLENILGEQSFKKTLQVYFDRWKGKHPTPYDFFFTFNEVTGENLNWFWKPWFFEFAYPDLAIEKIENNEVVIENKGKLPIPVKFKVVYEDNSMEYVDETANVWKTTNRIRMATNANKQIISVNLVTSVVPDVNPANDRMEE